MQRVHTTSASSLDDELSIDHQPTVTPPSYAELDAMLSPLARQFIERQARIAGDRQLEASAWFAIEQATGQPRAWVEGYLAWVAERLPPLLPVQDADSQLSLAAGEETKSPITGGSSDNQADRDENIELILEACRDQGVTSPISQAAILAIVSKESNFAPKAEKSYATSTVAYIREIYGLSAYSDDEIEKAKKDPDEFWEMVYGVGSPQAKGLGNTEPGDGGKFRGRGYNQITGRDKYERYGKLFGVDLVADPELLNERALATKVLVAYMKNCIAILAANGRLQADYGTTDINGFADLETAVYAFYNCNAGVGTSLNTIKGDKTGGLQRALANAPGLLAEIEAEQ